MQWSDCESAVSDGQTVAAYIVPMDDEHQSEYVSAFDKRITFISGFDGSAGTVVVLAGSTAKVTSLRNLAVKTL